MSWVKELTSFFKQVMVLEERVKRNTEELKALRTDLKEIVEATQRISNVISSEQQESQLKHDLLVSQLKNKLLEFEVKLETKGDSSQQLLMLLQELKGNQLQPMLNSQKDEES